MANPESPRAIVERIIREKWSDGRLVLARSGLVDAFAEAIQRAGCPMCCSDCQESTGGVCRLHSAEFGDRENPPL